MNFHQYWLGLSPGDERKEFAERAKSTVGYLNLVASGNKNPGETVCMNIEAASEGSVTCEELRPDVPWHVLRGTKAA